MRAFFTRIRSRILLIVILAIVPAVMLIYFSAAERKTQVSEEIENNALRLSRFLASNLERDLIEGEGFLRAVAKVAVRDSLDAGGCGMAMKEFLGDTSVYSNLGWIGAEGQVLCSAMPIPHPDGVRSFPWFDTLRSRPGFALGFDFKGTISPEAAIILVQPLDWADGRFRSALIAVMDLKWLNALARDAHLPEGSTIGVSNSRGDALARYPDPDKWVGKKFPGYPAGGERPQDGLTLQNGIDGVKRAYAYSKVKAKGDLLVHVGILREAIHEPANRALRSQLLALAVVAFLAVLAAWFGADVFLIKQVRALIDATQRLEAGNLSARSTLSYDTGELGDLARAFDKMAETLEWKEAQLRESETERANTTGPLIDMIEAAPEPFLVVGKQRELIGANSSAAAVFGYPYKAFMELSASDLFPADPGLFAADRAGNGRGDGSEPLRCKAKGCRKDGALIDVELSISHSFHSGVAVSMVILRMPHPNAAVS